MIRISMGAAAAALALASAAARAEAGATAPDTDSQTPSITDESGYQIDEASNGFQLVSHGVWPDRPGAGGKDMVSYRIRVPTQGRDAGSTLKRTNPSSFWRASYLPHVYAAEARFGLPRGLLDALIWTESRYNPVAVSRAGAAGLGQLMPGTARDLGVLNRFDPLQSVSGAARYLRQMLDRYGAIHLALAAYNAGPGAVDRTRGIPLNRETPEYVRNVLMRWRP